MRRTHLAVIGIYLVSSLAGSLASADEISVLSWNVESEGASPAVISEQLAELGQYHLYCFQEVQIRDAGRYAFAIREAFGQHFRYITTNTGRDDRLMIVYDTDRFDLIESRELFIHGEYELNSWRHRSPLVLVLRDKPSNKAFNLMTVHLARGDRQFRREQATGLREWAKQQSRSTVAIGDFNFDYDIRRSRGNPAFDAFTSGPTWKWIKPAKLVDTNWDDRDRDGKDNYPDSMLDFAFVAGENIEDSVATVIIRKGDFPDDQRTSDHRPLEMKFELD